MTQENRPTVKITVNLNDEEKEYTYTGFVLIGCSRTKDDKLRFDFSSNMPLEVGLVALQDMVEGQSEEETLNTDLLVKDGDTH